MRVFDDLSRFCNFNTGCRESACRNNTAVKLVNKLFAISGVKTWLSFLYLGKGVDLVTRINPLWAVATEKIFIKLQPEYFSKMGTQTSSVQPDKPLTRK